MRSIRPKPGEYLGIEAGTLRERLAFWLWLRVTRWHLRLAYRGHQGWPRPWLVSLSIRLDNYIWPN
jgi:hypothetical protein